MQVSFWINENKDSIIRLIELEDVISKDDPAEQPYKSQYSARDIMQNIVTDLDLKIKQGQIINDYNSLFVYLSLSYRLANNFIATEEKFYGEEILNKLCDKLEAFSEIKNFISSLPDKVCSTGDNQRLNCTTDEHDFPREKGEICQDELLKSLHTLAGILLKLYNNLGMLWASKIMNLTNMPPNTNNDVSGDKSSLSSVFDDLGVENSIKYLSRAKYLFGKYKELMKFSKEMSEEESIQFSSKTDFNLQYSPPQCLDSYLLDELSYETPYLKNESNVNQTNTQLDKSLAVKYDVFESDFTTTLFLMAQTFGKLTNHSYFKHKSARYCYWTLARQLNALKYDPVEWSLNAATLSQYYVTEKSFKRARHCIAAAQIIMQEAISRPTPGPNTNKPNPSEESNESGTKDALAPSDPLTNSNSESPNVDCDKTVDDIYEEILDQVTDIKMKEENSQQQLQHQKKKLLPDPMSVSRMWDDDVYEEKRVQGNHDIDRCWVSYGNALMLESAERLLPNYDIRTELTNVAIEKTMLDFNLDVSRIESQISCDWLTHYEEARQIFLLVQRKIKSAIGYYKIDYRCSDYIELIFEYSKAYKAIAKFETEVDRICCMHKKRIDMLNELLDKLNQQYYLIACRKMMMELGETYNEMAMFKASMLESPNTPEETKASKALLGKIRRLNHQGILMYQRFIESYRERSGHMPEVYSDDDIRPILIAHFYLGRMFHKSYEADIHKSLDNMRQSLYHYKFIVNYCKDHATAATLMAPELESCKDMVVLLPCKIDKVLATLN